MATKYRFLILLSLLVVIYQGCKPIADKPDPLEPKTDPYGCVEPPNDVFTSIGVDTKIKSTFGKVVTGDIDIKTDPQVFTLASKAVTDARIRDYLRCLAIHRDHYTNEQAVYLDQSISFMQTNPPPTPDQFLSWQRQNPFPRSPTPSSIPPQPPVTVEAEDCHTSGTWKVWALPEFSGGRCINNEDPIRMGKATDAALYLNFRGTGVTIIYRQDIWYGSLAVEIDREEVGFINQKGQIKNQAEWKFRAGNRGQHSLVLRGSEATGVITVDAIRILND